MPARTHGRTPGSGALTPQRASRPFMAQASSCIRLLCERQVTESEIDEALIEEDLA